MSNQNARDPRETITPESFAIDPQLLGLPLARPTRRAVAMAVDLLVVAVLVNMGGGLLFGLAAAWVFLRVSRRAAGGGLIRRSWRFAFRSFAAVALFAVGSSLWGSWRSAPPEVADDAEVAEAPAIAAAVDADSVLRVHAAALAAGDAGARQAVASDLRRAFAADDAAASEPRAERLARENRRLRRDLEEAREERGVLSFLRASADDLGLTFGWVGLYFTSFLALWRGQTPGKRLMRIRVVRLDGKPMTWWASFERFGGYAASLVTGLLGFVQILWDRNRQGMHDKITETVVVRL